MKGNATVLLNRLLARGKFRHVEILLKVAELGSVQKAAAAIGMTQSAASQSLAHLEQLLETTLFLRHARGVRPTAAAIDLLPVARRLMGGVVDAADRVAAHGREGQGTVRIVASAAAINAVLIPRLPRFHARHPSVEVQLALAEGEDQLLAISRDEVDLVACRRPPVLPQGWSFRALLDDRYVVACAPTHPLRRRRAMSFDALKGQTWLAAPVGTAARARLDEATAAWPAGPTLHPLVTRLLGPLRAQLESGERVSLLPLSFVKHLVDQGALATLPVSEAMPMEPIGLLHPQADLRQSAALVVEFLAGRKG